MEGGRALLGKLGRLRMNLRLRYARAAYFIGAMIIALAASGTTEASSDYPNRVIRIVVGFAPGSPSDIATRVIGAKMAEVLGQQIVVENKPGASGMIAADMVARSDADGYTLVNTPTAYAVNEILAKSTAKNMRIAMGKDLIAVAPQAQTVNVLVVHPELGIKTVADLVSLAKQKPGEIFFGTSGRGSSSHLASELFNLAAGIKTTAVHYRGGADSVKDLLKGEIKMLFATIAPVQGLIKEGKLVALATTGLARDPSFPDLPTIAESGYPDYSSGYWMGLSAPAGTPSEIIKALENANSAALKDAKIKESLATFGFTPMTGSSHDFDKFYQSEREKWSAVIRETKIDQE